MKACYPWSKIYVRFSSSNKNEFWIWNDYEYLRAKCVKLNLNLR